MKAKMTDKEFFELIAEPAEAAKEVVIDGLTFVQEEGCLVLKDRVETYDTFHTYSAKQ